MSSSTPIPRTSGPTRAAGWATLLAVLLPAVLLVLVVPGAAVAASADGPNAVPAGTWDGRSRLTVTLPQPAPVSVAVDDVPVAAEVVPLLSDRTATAVVVDTSDAGRAVLQPGLSGAASLVLAAPPAARTAVVADTSPPAVLSPLQAGPAGALQGLAQARAGGARQTDDALGLALAQLPPEVDDPRLVVLYTAAPDGPVPPADLARTLAAAGAVLAVVVPSDGGAVPAYWQQVAAATGGLAVAAPGTGVVDAFDVVGAALRARYLVCVPAPARLPAQAAVRVDTGAGPVTLPALLAAPAPPASGTATGGGGPRKAVALGGSAALLAVVAGLAVLVRRLSWRRGRSAPTAWNVPAPPHPAVDRDGQSAAVRAALQAGRPAVLRPVDGAAGLGTTAALAAYAHRHRAAYDVAWWVPAADPPLVADRLAELAEVLGVADPDDSAPAAADRLLTALGERHRWLLVLDDAGSPRQLSRFLPRGGHVLVGSDDPEWAAHATPVAVAPFARVESTDLLRARRPGLSAAEADRVAAAVGDVPLAVDLAGATLAETDTDVDAYLRALGAHGSGAHGSGADAAVAVALDRLAADEPAAATLLTLLAWLGADPVPLWLLGGDPPLPDPLAAAVGSPGGLDAVLATLERRGLARVDGEAGAGPGERSVRLHPTPAAQLVARATDATGANGTAATWAATAVRLLRRAAPADPARPDARTAWRRLLPHVLAVTDPGRRLDDVLGEVGWLLHHAGRHLQVRGEPRAARALFEDAYDLYRRRLGPEHADTRAVARTLADDLRALGEHEQARRVLQEAGVGADRGTA